MNAPPKKPLSERIASLNIRGFRSLACLEDLPLPQLAVLIGANGSGKSNLIRFFELLGWMLRSQHLQEFIERQGGADDQLFMGAKRTPRLEAELGIETEAGLNEYRFALTPAAGDRLVLVEEAYRFSRLDRPGLNTWTELPMPAREARLVEQAGEDRTASVIVRLLRNCVTYQFHDTSAGAAIKRPWDVTDAA
ncbi:MAG: AAA family ATPase [Chromatiaceae bacterium]|nr:AAA family ATPase [Chromatiaceae bacterium]